MIKSPRAKERDSKLNLQNTMSERKKCSVDPLYTMNKYFKLSDPQYGKFSMFVTPHQQEFLNELQAHRHLITLQPRQSGQTTLILMYLLWRAMFENVRVLYVAPNQLMAILCVDTVLTALQNLPPSLSVLYRRVGMTFEISTGGSIEIMPASTAFPTSKQEYITLGDFAFLPVQDQLRVFTSAVHTLTPNGQLVVGSTPRAANDVFHQLWSGATTGTNTLFPFRVTWQQVILPSKYLSLRQILGDDVMRREYDCEFLP